MLKLLPLQSRISKVLPYVFSLLLIVTAAQAQLAVEWERVLPKTDEQILNTIVQTQDGGYIAAGNFQPITSLPGQDNEEFRVIKISDTGTTEWEKVFSGSDLEENLSVIQAADGGYLIGCESRSDRNANKSEDDHASADFERGDYWIIKLAADGSKQWDRTIGGDNVDVLQSVRTTADGGFLLGGSSFSGVSGDKKSPLQGYEDIWIVKISANGIIQWEKSISGTEQDFLATMHVTADGIILGGSSASPSGLDKSQNVVGEFDFWIVKLSLDGNKIWDSTIGGPGFETLSDIQITSDGGYILCGSTRSEKGGNKSEPGRGSSDYWVVKIDGSGNVQWDKTLGGQYYDYVRTILQVADGGYIVGGSSTSQAGGDRKAPEKTAGSAWLVKLDANGKKVWDQAFGGTNTREYSAAYKLIASADGGYMMAGAALSPQGSGDITMPTIRSDAWIVKLRSEGNTRKIQLSAGTVNLATSPSSVNASQTLTLNTSSTLETFTIQSPSAGWLTVTSNAGNIKFSADASGLKPGKYMATVTINANGYVRAIVPVTLTVRLEPEISFIENIIRPVNQLIAFTAKAVVNPGEYVVFSMTGSPAGSQLDSAGNFRWTPSVPGTYDFTINARTSGSPVLTAARNVRIIVESGDARDVVRINAGGGDYRTVDGRYFQADQYYTGEDGISAPQELEIAGTDDDALYSDARRATQFAYAIPVKNGSHRVTLHFAEVYWGTRPAVKGPDSRKFNILAEGSTRFYHYDIFSQAGGALKAVQTSFDVLVSDGMLNLNFESIADKARLAAIEVVYQEVSTITLAPVADAYVRGGIYSNTNFGSEPALETKARNRPELNRASYLKFSLAGYTEITNAKLRLYGYNHEADKGQGSAGIEAIDDNNWTETGITANAPTAKRTSLRKFNLAAQPGYIELDLTSFVQSRLSGDKVFTLLLSDVYFTEMRGVFTSKESASNPPQLVITTIGPGTSGARLAQLDEKTASEQENTKEQSSVFPNPVKDRMTIIVSHQHAEDVNVQLMGVSGTHYPLKLQSELAPGSKADLNLSDLALESGIYLLKVQSSKHLEVIKVLIAN